MVTLESRWARAIDQDKPWPEYPRPQLKRESWQNLNGPWQYAIVDGAPGELPDRFDGEITVPFSPECALSGASRQLLPGQTLWYRRVVRFDNHGALLVTVLHFGAVDQCCAVYVNGRLAGRHEGGYLPFSLDISALIAAGENVIALCVTDESDTGIHAYGKQSLKRGGIWYTAQSGIWQTVWAEFLPDNYLTSLTVTPDLDAERVHLSCTFSRGIVPAHITVTDGDTIVFMGETDAGALTIPLPGAKVWTPDAPFLYGLRITAGDDAVDSYFGMRKFSIMKDAAGYPRFALNNAPIFLTGLLDQGYWSDGLLTPPCDEAMAWEIATLKDLGFNLLRKHIKIEPLRWYYHCDRLGMLVWQDFVSGGAPAHGTPAARYVTQIAPFIGVRLRDGARNYRRFGRSDAAGRAQFEKDARETAKHLYNAVSLCAWVPFNEGWGQFDAAEMAGQVKSWDPTRPIDHASGWHDQRAGDFLSKHIYYKRYRHQADKYGRAAALTEFGGYSCPVPGHMAAEKPFGYKIYADPASLTNAFVRLYREEVLPAIPRGLCAAIYTQVSDVEDEINGLFTYDRAALKIGADAVRALNEAMRGRA